MGRTRGVTGMSLHDRVVRILDSYPDECGVLIYDRDLRLLAEREPGDSAVIVVLDRKPADRHRGVREE